MWYRSRKFIRAIGLLDHAKAKGIVNAAIKRSETDRFQIVEEILASLEPDTNDDVEALWVAEVERRSQEIKQDVVRSIPWAKVKLQARKRGRGHG